MFVNLYDDAGEMMILGNGCGYIVLRRNADGGSISKECPIHIMCVLENNKQYFICVHIILVR